MTDTFQPTSILTGEDGRDAVNETVRWMDIFAGPQNRIDEKNWKRSMRQEMREVSAMLRFNVWEITR